MTIEQFILKPIRAAYRKIFGVYRPVSAHHIISDPQAASDLIYEHLTSDKPCMIARFGSTELMTVVNYMGVHRAGKKRRLNYIRGREPDWWWNEKCLLQMRDWSGFFPPTPKMIERFCEMMICDAVQTDILGSWLEDERFFEKDLRRCRRIDFELLNPFFAPRPWSKALEGKKVLVVHPFAQSIGSQYRKRELLFENRDILPGFELKTIRAVQSLGGEDNGFADWFEALDSMKSAIDGADYDVCLVGCGAYGFPLAAHVKRMGKKAVHLGGSLQLLFGIRGARWEDTSYNATYNYTRLMNEHWMRPGKNEKPKNADTVETACYW